MTWRGGVVDMYNRWCCCCCCMMKILLLLTPSCSPPVEDERLNDDFCVPHDDDDPNRYIMGRSVLVNLNDILAGCCGRLID